MALGAWLAHGPARFDRTILLLAMLLGWCVHQRAEAQSARVTMTASTTRVAVGEPFVVEIRVEVTGGELDDLELPDFGSLEVLGQRSSRPFSFSFGFGSGGNHAVMRSEVVRSFTLRATTAERINLAPAVAIVDGRRIASRPLSITVIAGAAPPSTSLPGGAPDTPANADLVAPPEGPLDGATYDATAFLRTVVDKKNPIVGEQITVTVYLYVRGSLGAVPSVTREATANGFWIQDLLGTHVPPPTRQAVNGRPFTVYVLRRFAAFALKPGALEIGAPALEIGGSQSIFDLITGPAEPLSRSGVAVPIEVRPLPPGVGHGVPTLVGDGELSASLDRSAAQVGEAVTLEVKVSGHGNLRAIEFADPKLNGIDTLKPEVSDQLVVDGGQVGGTRTFRWLLLTRAPGHYAVPSFEIEVVDPSTGSAAKKASPALSLDVTGAALPAESPTPRAAASEETQPAWGTLRHESVLLRRVPAPHEQPWFWPLVAAGPALLSLGAAGRRALRVRAERFARGGEGRALSSAQKELESAQEAVRRADGAAAASAMSAALKRALEARLGEPIGGLTHSALRAHLIQRGMGSPLAERIAHELERCDQARFNPLGSSATELATLLEKSRGLLREIARFEARRETT